MKRDVVLSIQGRQHYGDQEPETIELVTEGTMEFRDGGWDITYEESELTGLAGVVTTFRVEPGKVMLNREGALNSRMLFQEGVAHDSLYQMEYGTLMMIWTSHWLLPCRPKSGMNPFPGKKALSTAARGSICFLRTLNCPAWK